MIKQHKLIKQLARNQREEHKKMEKEAMIKRVLLKKLNPNIRLNRKERSLAKKLR